MLIFPFLSRASTTIRVRNTAVMKEATRPIISVVANPLMGPVPTIKRIAAVMMVVILESKIAENALP